MIFIKDNKIVAGVLVLVDLDAVAKFISVEKIKQLFGNVKLNIPLLNQ